MEIVERTIRYYVTSRGRVPFREWLNSLKDFTARKLIQVKIERLRAGNFSQCLYMGGGISELRIFFGPGYRIYFAQIHGLVVLLLVGGSKGTQRNDIQTAIEYWEDFKRRTK